MRKINTLLLVGAFFVVFSTHSFSQEQAPAYKIGSVASVIKDLQANYARANLSYHLPISSEKEIEVSLSDFYQENEKLSMNGTVKNHHNSVFIFKGDHNGLYGFAVLHDLKKAYEYTTDKNGSVVVNEVSIAKLVPDLYSADMRKPTKEINGPRAILARDYSPMAFDQLPYIGKYDDRDVNSLESLPGAKLVFYLDITRIMNGDTPKYMSKEEIYINWQCVSDQLSMYNVNVTTSKSIYDAAGVTNSGVARFVDEDGRSFAYLNTFGTTNFSTIFKYPNGYNYGRTATHEGLHQLGLSHDGGQPGGEYYEGIPAFQWVPIMGNFWFGNNWEHALFQFSKGEYSGASQREDDLTVVKRYLPFKEDDNPTSKPMNIASDGSISPKENWGHIETNTDNDVFDFEIGNVDSKMAGHLTLKLDPIELISMLDIEAEIQKADGSVVAKSNLDVNRSAEFDLDLDPGKYKLVIKGGAEGTPQNGFSNYSSMGVFAMEGKITGGITTHVSASILENSISIYPVPSTNQINIDMPKTANLGQIQITSSLGKVVYNGSQKNSINVSHLPTGVYFMRLNVDGETIVKKFTKK